MYSAPDPKPLAFLLYNFILRIFSSLCPSYRRQMSVTQLVKLLNVFSAWLQGFFLIITEIAQSKFSKKEEMVERGGSTNQE